MVGFSPLFVHGEIFTHILGCVMSNQTGSILWCDLTVEHAETLRDFYQNVVGWSVDSLNMGDYDDYVMKTPESGAAVAGICHAKGSNAELPSQWLMYFKVGDLETALSNVITGGGKALTAIKAYSNSSRYVVIQDPAGAVCALFEEQS